jgi:hypothetical protein
LRSEYDYSFSVGRTVCGYFEPRPAERVICDRKEEMPAEVRLQLQLLPPFNFAAMRQKFEQSIS